MITAQKASPHPVASPASTKPKQDKRRQSTNKKGKKEQSSAKSRNDLSTSRTRSRRPVDDEIIVPIESARKQMLVSANQSQTQIVILEGPVLVEHYVAREDSNSVAGNIYLAIARNVLPGMEAAFLDFGASKDFKTHYAWLPSGRWGLESLANLDAAPARGATLVVGAPKIRGATGGPTRVLALI